MGIVKKEYIQTNQIATDWQDAIRKAGQPLVDAGAIKGSYVENMINVVKELGPYIVIAPHIAVAHARPNGDVLRDELSVLLLDNEVNFNCSNDPVKVIICMASVDDDQHMELLKKLATLLDEETCKKMLLCTNAEELYRVLGYA